MMDPRSNECELSLSRAWEMTNQNLEDNLAVLIPELSAFTDLSEKVRLVTGADLLARHARFGRVWDIHENRALFRRNSSNVALGEM